MVNVFGAAALAVGGYVLFRAVRREMSRVENRVADSTGAPLEADKEEMSAALRAEIGIDVFAANHGIWEKD